MKKYLNDKVNPCDNFYEYACGNFAKHNAIPSDMITYDVFEILRENLDYALKDVLDNLNETNQLSKDYFENYSILNGFDKNDIDNGIQDVFMKAKLLYKSCMQQDIIEKRGDAPLRKLLSDLNGWPIIESNWNESKFNLINLLGQLRLLNNDLFLTQWIGPDLRNTSRYILNLDETTLGLPGRHYFLNSSYSQYLDAYKTFLTDVARILAPKNVDVTDDVYNLIDFEMELANIMESPEEKRNHSNTYYKTTIKALPKLFPRFRWREYFNMILGRKDSTKDIPVALFCSRYLRRLLYLLRYTPKRVIQNYLIWRFVRHRVNNLDQRFSEARNKFYQVMVGSGEDQQRWFICIGHVNNNMGMILGSLFVQKFFNKVSKDDTIEITKRIESALRESIKQSTWLHKDLKTFADMKIAEMDLKIGYPDFILNKTELSSIFNDVKIHSDYFFENVLILLKHLARYEQNKLNTVIDKKTWTTPPAVINAYYNRNKNQIIFPAGMLQPPFYHRHFPKSLNYGGIGIVIGHEIIHAFDDKGRLFDHKGNYQTWLNNNAIENLDEKSQCLIDQYNKYIIPDIDKPVNGEMTQGENVADNGGLTHSFKAYEKWLNSNPDEDESLPGLNLTAKQLFFLNFAQIWCGNDRIELTKMRFDDSEHSPGIFRVIGAISNSEDFAKAFNCPKNAPMNPESKCTVW